MALRGVGADDIAILPAATSDGQVTLPAKVSTVPRRFVPVRAGSMFPRSVLGPSMMAIPTALGGATGIGEAVINPFTMPDVVGGSSGGGAATPLPPPAVLPTSPLIYTGIRDPRHAVFAMSTYTDTNNTRQLFIRRALASYWTITNFTVATPTLVADTPTTLLSFTVSSSNYVADSFAFYCSSQALLGLFQFQVDVNGDLRWGPQYLLEGKADLNIFATMGQTINVSIIVPSAISFVAGGRILLNGYRDVT